MEETDSKFTTNIDDSIPLRYFRVQRSFIFFSRLLKLQNDYERTLLPLN